MNHYININKDKCEPTELTIKVGDTVEFVNKDNSIHSVQLLKGVPCKNDALEFEKKHCNAPYPSEDGPHNSESSGDILPGGSHNLKLNVGRHLFLNGKAKCNVNVLDDNKEKKEKKETTI